MVSLADAIKETRDVALSHFKARLTQMLFPQWGNWQQYPALGGTRVNYSTRVDPRGSSIVMACIGWMQRNFPEAPLIVEQIGLGDDPDQIIPNHPFSQLVARPNPWYSGNLLWQATIPDYMLGNAYWVSVPNRGNKPVEIWWVPSSTIEPKWPERDNSVFISHYEMTVDNETVEIPPENVTHFRWGIDPNNTRKGLSPLGSLFRELFTDNEAANWTASLLANGAVPGLVIAPENEKVQIDATQAEAMKALAKQKFGSDRRGEPMVLSHAAKVFQAAFNPQQMNLRDLRKIPEERVTAIFGTPAVVVGLGAGLDRSTFANFAEAREAAYESFMIPHKTSLAEELNVQLLPRFADPKRFRVGWDYSRVKVLQEDEDKKHTRAREDFKSGIIMLDEARELVGLPALEGNKGKLFAVGMSVTLTPVDELWSEPEPVPAELLPGNTPPALPPGRELNEDDLPDSEEEEEGEGETAPRAGKSAGSPLGSTAKRRKQREEPPRS